VAEDANAEVQELPMKKTFTSPKNQSPRNVKNEKRPEESKAKSKEPNDPSIEKSLRRSAKRLPPPKKSKIAAKS